VTQGSGGGTAVSRSGGPGGGGFAGVSGGGDVYAGRDGNVYRKQGDGWQKYENGGWNDTASATPQDRNRTGNTAGTGDRTPGASTRPSTVDRGQLDSDSRARTEGAKRTSDMGSVRSGTASRPTSYRPTGGGVSRGGGGGRRR
jgi:hypothetical protein